LIAKFLVLVVFLSWVPLAHSEEIRPGVLRTPDARFVDLEGYPFDAHYMEIDGMRVHYLDEGPRDAEPILLIHGEPTWSYLFRKMIPILVEAGYRVVAPDLVGFGKSDKYAEEATYSYTMQVAFMRELVVRLDLRDATFFGQDWGGLIGLRVVAAEPDRFARVVVSNTGLASAGGVAGSLGYPLFKAAVWWLGPITSEELKADVTFPRWVAYSQNVEDLPVGEVMTLLGGGDELRKPYEAPFPDQSYKAAAKIMPYLVLSQLRENEEAWETVFDKWDKPFLVAFTDADPITAGGEAVFLERVPTAQNVTIRGASHFVQEDAGPELARLMVDFMQGRSLPTEISVDREQRP
jgi:haloalkane dehalogenase